MKASHDKNKSFADWNKLFKGFHVWEHIHWWIKTMKISLRIGSCAKLTPWFCGPYSIIQRIGLAAYWLALPLTVKFNDVFHMSFLKKYDKDVNHVIDWSILKVELDGEFMLDPQCIFQKMVLMLWNWEIEKVKVQWKHFRPDEATWEMVN